ncbi:GUN4 domain-containing protein [Oscillatoriales cyanobacterium LEGE 11467]|uniref:GUN4 domain-containing protein n=1 Tax=Zarconia navalis LEGE 11467 TaxID=1828826 RepID=A0A928ZA29_9CYAN|nr:GUN4 domain-containing protein [Zarconia navalis]MBE9042293.1 GUN4 domain-containing protein [Zarconia navalis LEGE 11467]
MENSQEDSQDIIGSQLTDIQNLLKQFNTRLSAIESQLEKDSTPSDSSTDIGDRLDRIEKNLLLIPDLYRYRKLQNHLASGEWSDADYETIHLILDISGESELENLTPSEIEQFPCNALKTIDRLWREYSDGRFGFLTQLELYQSIGGDLTSTIRQDRALVEKWGDKAGWRVNGKWLKCSELDYSLSAPEGCHPSRWWNSPYGSKMTNYFLARLMACELTG